MAIGDFSRATHLSVKALRHYHDVELLSPLEVNRRTGYRFYGTDQIKDAQVIRHLRKLEMPVEEVKAVLRASGQVERDEIVIAHLERMEAQLESTRQTVSLLRAMLGPATPISVEHRSVPIMLAAAVTETVQLNVINAWWSEAFEEIYGVLRAAEQEPAGPGGGIYSTELFTDEIGESTIYVPISKRIEPSRRVQLIEIPAANLAVVVHSGALAAAGPSYAALGNTSPRMLWARPVPFANATSRYADPPRTTRRSRKSAGRSPKRRPFPPNVPQVRGRSAGA